MLHMSWPSASEGSSADGFVRLLRGDFRTWWFTGAAAPADDGFPVNFVLGMSRGVRRASAVGRSGVDALAGQPENVCPCRGRTRVRLLVRQRPSVVQSAMA